MVDGLIKLMNSPPKVTGPVNLGNPAEFSILEFAKQVIALTASNSPVEHFLLPADDPMRRRPDITRARELLDWEPVTPLNEGIARTVNYFRRALAS